MHSLPAVCIVAFVFAEYPKSRWVKQNRHAQTGELTRLILLRCALFSVTLYHFCRQFFVLPGFITIFQIFVKSLTCHFQRFAAEWNSAFCASFAGFERNELHSLLLVYFRRLAAKKLPPHSRNTFSPEAACFPCSAALPRFAATGSPPPGSMLFCAVYADNNGSWAASIYKKTALNNSGAVLIFMSFLSG